MKSNIIIVDDFYDDPQAIREFALNSPYSKPERSTYPGRNSDNNLFTDEAASKLSILLGKDVRTLKEDMNAGGFRISIKDDTYEQLVHVDPWEWGAIVYLNLPHQIVDEAGTSFYINKKLKTERAPFTPQEGYEQGFYAYSEVHSDLICRSGNNEDEWDRYGYVPMKYNRLVLFNTSLWHSHSFNFGSNIHDGRLIQLFFFESKQKPVSNG